MDIRSGRDWAYASAGLRVRNGGEAKFALLPTSGCRVAAFADGAAGIGFGPAAAAKVVETVTGLHHRVISEGKPRLPVWLHQADVDIDLSGIDGEASAIILTIRDMSVIGCSAGDCESWVFLPDGTRAIPTAGQARRPRLGTLGSAPAAFGPLPFPPGSRLLLMTRGVAAAVPEADICRAAMAGTGLSAAENLVARAASIGNGDASQGIAAAVLTCLV